MQPASMPTTRTSGRSISRASTQVSWSIEHRTLTAGTAGVRAGRPIAARSRLRGQTHGLDHCDCDRYQRNEAISRRYTATRGVVRAQSRDIKVLFLVYPVLGETDQEAYAKRERMVSSPHFIERALASTATVTDIDFLLLQ